MGAIYTLTINRIHKVKKRAGLFKKKEVEITENLFSWHYSKEESALEQLESLGNLLIDGFRRCWMNSVKFGHTGPCKVSPEIDGWYEAYITHDQVYD